VANAFSEVPVELNFIFIFFKMIIKRRRRGRKKEKERQCTPPINFNILLAYSPLYIAYIRSFYSALPTADSRHAQRESTSSVPSNDAFSISLITF